MNIIENLFFSKGGRVTIWRVGNIKMRALVNDENKIISSINYHTLEKGHPTLYEVASRPHHLFGSRVCVNTNYLL